MNRQLSGCLDCARWMAALFVILSHTANIMTARYADTPHALRSPILFIWVFLGGFGHESVTIFFVLSGFLVGGRMFKRVLESGSIEWSRYILDRIVRIHLVLIPALCLTYVVDLVASHYTPAIMQPFVTQHTTWRIFLGNICNLQNFYVDFFGADGPIGTLANEFWYYFTFPLLLGLFLFKRPLVERWVLFIGGIVLCVVFWKPQWTHLLGFLIWGSGVAFANLKRPLMRNLPLATALLFLVVLAIRLVMRRDMSGNAWELFIADVFLLSAFGNLLLTLRFLPEPAESVLYSPVHKTLAGFSYSLYACHMPLLFLFTGMFKFYTGFGTNDFVTSYVQWLEVLTVIVLLIAVAYLVSLGTERHTASVRSWVYHLFGVEWRKPGTAASFPVPQHPALGQEPDR